MSSAVSANGSVLQHPPPPPAAGGAPAPPSATAKASTVDQTPQPQTAAESSSFPSNHHHHHHAYHPAMTTAAAKVTPHEPSPPSSSSADDQQQHASNSKQGVRFASVSKRGRYTSPAGRGHTSIATADVGSPAPSLCSAPSHEEPKKPAATKSSSGGAVKLQAPASPVRDPTKSPTGLFLQASPGVTSTPTNFATDYTSVKSGSNGNFDTSNVLAWLQSPTGLFSPGWNSMLNTPRGCGDGGGRSGATPVATVSTSFFFSDVAGLPKTTMADDKSICISPLATNRRSNYGQQTPVDMKDIFSSPAERKYRAHASGNGNPSLDAVVMAERDLMEDEDLSVLLQLASNTTPRHARNGEAAKGNANENLQLPMIGNNGKPSIKPRLQQKTSSQKQQDDFAPPQLGMRPGSSSTAAVTSSAAKPAAAPTKKSSKEQVANTKPAKSSKKASHAPPAYPDNPYYTSTAQMPPGSMRVTVGATQKKQSANPSPPPHRYDYPYNPPPHMGAYPPFMTTYPPYTAYPPPPPPRPTPGLYPASQQPTIPNPKAPTAPTTTAPKTTKQKRTKKSNESTQKRKASLDTVASTTTTTSNKSAKSAKKTSPKKKNKSPIPDKAERAQAAATIKNLNQAAGGHNDKAAALAAAILRGVTMRPSGKWQAQLYFAGKSRYIGVFDTREKAALAYEIAREKLKTGHVKGSDGATTENLVNEARKAAFDGVNEQL